MQTFTWDPLIPAPALATLWAGAIALALLYVFWRPTRLMLSQRLILGALHFGALACVLALLHRPTWVLLSEGTKPVLQVLVDTSASMATPDCGPDRSRHAAAVEALGAWRKEWERDFSVQLAGFDRTVSAAASLEAFKAAPPAGVETNLAIAIEGALRLSPKPAALLVLSDGIHNAAEADPQAAARQARAEGVPVFTHCLGSAVNVRDVGVKLSSSEELAFVRQRARVPAIITQIGYDNAEADVELRFGGKVIEKKKIRFAAGVAETPVEFTVSQETPGLYSYEIAVPPLPGEALVTNNRRRFALRVVNERIRILLLEGKPYWDSKFLARVLDRDPNVLLTSATQMRKDRVVIEPPALLAAQTGGAAKPAGSAGVSPAEAQAGAPAPSWIEPREPNKLLEDQRFLAQFQVLILGRDIEVFLTDPAIENLRNWVARSGGHLVCVRGRPAGELALQPAFAALLPVAWKSSSEQRFHLELTERGRALALFDVSAPGRGLEENPDVILRALPTLVTATVVDRQRSLSVVLARATAQTGEPMAVLSVQDYGTGKTVVLEGQGMWRWAFRPPGDKLHADDLFHAFWSNMVRWLAGSNDFLPSQSAALRAGKALYQSGERPSLYVLERELSAPVAGSSAAAGQSPRIELAREDESGAL
ncbi:MAG: vWA domain-containing protein, partial [Planctomycetota bacterium]